MSIHASLTFHFPSGLYLHAGTSLQGQQPGRDARMRRRRRGKKQKKNQLKSLLGFITSTVKLMSYKLDGLLPTVPSNPSEVRKGWDK